MSPTNPADALPPTLAERLRVVAEEPYPEDGRHVVYWMHHAVRGHENPALDTALLAAAALARPLLVYQGLGGRHRYQNDRHHTFILQGARDVRVELEARGVAHVFWLGEDPEAPSPLRALVRDAALVVTEDFPAPPIHRWTRRLAKRTRAPVWAVDTACVVPMRRFARPFDRAFAFREAHQRLLGDRLDRPWDEVDVPPCAFDRAHLPFPDVDLASADFEALVATCPIDHTVGPVAHTRGGSEAGYARWAAFRAAGLSAYARRRNDGAADGVSRLSAYLHHGHVSPFRIAREAAAEGGPGAEKFLDELLVWRELAHNLCFHRLGEVETLDVLPRWARETLDAHRAESRGRRTWETLARGVTGDRLWDLAQASLVRHGELHNNVRMTWGKALAGWTRDPEEALARLLDLNHRFALDGSDPNSYGGLLWCLGLFDRPFDPERPVLGVVRSRPTASHAKRLDLDRYAARVLAPSTARPLRVAVIGAGLSGLASARTLHDHGHRVRVIEKARGVGGRMARRRAVPWAFDHGAQYFTACDERFVRCVESWEEDGIVARWPVRPVVLASGHRTVREDDTPRFVGMPGMSAVCRHLARDLDVALRTRVGRVERVDGRWQLEDDAGKELGLFDALVVSAPAPQAVELIRDAAPALAVQAAQVELAPCWAGMVAFAEPLELGFDAAFVRASPLSWVARNAAKPGRGAGEAWVLHGSPAWSREHLETEAPEAARRLLEAFETTLGAALPAPAHLDAHRWRYALPEAPRPEACLFDGELGLAVCGDAFGGPRVEGAFLSGCAAAGRLLGLRPGPLQGALFADA